MVLKFSDSGKKEKDQSFDGRYQSLGRTHNNIETLFSLDCNTSELSGILESYTAYGNDVIVLLAMGVNEDESHFIKIYRTENKGKRWEKVYDYSGDIYKVYSLKYIGNNIFMVIMNEEYFIISADLGLNWTMKATPTSDKSWTSAVYYDGKLLISNKEIYTVEDYNVNKIFYSEDYGETWNEIIIETDDYDVNVMGGLSCYNNVLYFPVEYGYCYSRLEFIHDYDETIIPWIYNYLSPYNRKISGKIIGDGVNLYCLTNDESGFYGNLNFISTSTFPSLSNPNNICIDYANGKFLVVYPSESSDVTILCSYDSEKYNTVYKLSEVTINLNNDMTLYVLPYNTLLLPVINHSGSQKRLELLGIPCGDSSRTIITEDISYIPVEELDGSINDEKWLSATLAPNGYIYALPYYDVNKILKIDPSTDTFTTFGDFPAYPRWMACALARDNFIYGVTRIYNHVLKVLKLNPVNDSYTTFEYNVGPSFMKFINAIALPNGIIYVMPYSAQSILKVDVNTTPPIVSFVPIPNTPPIELPGYFWGIYIPSGYIYGIPLDTTTILKINPYTTPETITGIDISDIVGELNPWYQWEGGVAGDNGCIYGIPCNSNSILKIDTRTVPETITTIDCGELYPGHDIDHRWKWNGGVLAPNGCIYGVPRNSMTMLKIDTRTNPETATTFGTLTSGHEAWHIEKWRPGILAPNGSIYMIPSYAKYILKLAINSQ